MTFSYPPKRMKTAVHGIENLTVRGIMSPGALERELVMEDGRGPSRIPNGNAFKSIHIVRDGEELGSLFELRSTFYQQYLAPNADEGPRKALEKELGLSPMAITIGKTKRLIGSRSRIPPPTAGPRDEDSNGYSKTPTRSSGRRRTTTVQAPTDDEDEDKDDSSDDDSGEDEDEVYDEKPKKKRKPSSPKRKRVSPSPKRTRKRRA